MQLTTRGYAVVVVCAGSFLLAQSFGARSLHVIVIAGVVTVLAGAVQLYRLDPPRLERDVPPDGHVGERHPVTLEFFESDGSDRPSPFVAIVEERLQEGLDPIDETRCSVSDPGSGHGARLRFRSTVGVEPLTCEVEYTSRGPKEIGPTTLRARDAFGLLEQPLESTDTDRVLVYPERYPITASLRGDLERSIPQYRHHERDEFDLLREYEPGDDLRDVHWPTTAKRDELVVKEFAAANAGRVSIAGGAARGAADEMASAVTSIALSLLEARVPVVVELPSGSVEATPGQGRNDRLLELLATTDAGSLPEEDADVAVYATDEETTVRLGNRRTTFRRLRTERPGGDSATRSRTARREGPPAAKDPNAGSEFVTSTDGGSNR